MTSLTPRISYFHCQGQDVLDGNSVMSLFVNIRIRLRKIKRESVESTICHQEGRSPLAHHERHEEHLEVYAWNSPIQRQGRDRQYRLLQMRISKERTHVHESKEKVNKLGCDNANYKLGWVYPYPSYPILPGNIYTLALSPSFALESRRKRERERDGDDKV